MGSVSAVIQVQFWLLSTQEVKAKVTSVSKSPLSLKGDRWDSLGHMSLIAALEDSLGIVLDADDIVNFSSYSLGQKLLTKYGVTFPPKAER